ncbi:MAG: hypothetical protein K2X99_10080 [Gemmatimonadaceae bacterium]|nr:hypothetical protein [Gemmatimonadaceae bacterium]
MSNIPIVQFVERQRHALRPPFEQLDRDQRLAELERLRAELARTRRHIAKSKVRDVIYYVLVALALVALSQVTPQFVGEVAAAGNAGEVPLSIIVVSWGTSVAIAALALALTWRASRRRASHRYQWERRATDVERVIAEGEALV